MFSLAMRAMALLLLLIQGAVIVNNSPAPSSGSFTFVSKDLQSSYATSRSCTLTSLQAGDQIFVFSSQSSTDQAISVSDGANTFVPIRAVDITPGAGLNRTALWRVQSNSVVGSDTITVSVAGSSSFLTISCEALRGGVTNPSIDTSAFAVNTSTTSLNSGNITPAGAGEVMFGWAASDICGPPTSLTPGTGYTSRGFVGGSTVDCAFLEDSIGASGGAQAATMTVAPSSTYVMYIVSVKP